MREQTKTHISAKFANNPHNRNVAETELSAQIIALLEHYKQKDPVGLPGAPVPDPLPGNRFFLFHSWFRFITYSWLIHYFEYDWMLLLFRLIDSLFSAIYKTIDGYGHTHNEKCISLWFIKVSYQKRFPWCQSIAGKMNQRQF